jgi:hypothetical protein
MQPEGLGKLKKFIHLIGSRTRNLPTCSIVLQPLRYHMSLLTVLRDIKQYSVVKV